MLLPLLACLTLSVKPQHDIVSIMPAPDDQWFAVTNATDKLYIFSMSGTLLRTVQAKPGSLLYALDISPDGTSVICGNAARKATPAVVWNTKTWKETAHIGLWSSKTSCDPPAGVRFAANGKYIVGATAFSHQLVCWDAQSGKTVYVERRKKTGVFYGFTLNPFTTLVAYKEGGTKEVWLSDFENQSTIADWGESIDIDASKIRKMAFSRGGKRLLVETEPMAKTCQIDIYEPRHGKATIVTHSLIRNFNPRSLTWSNDDQLIWVAGLDGQIICIDAEQGHLKNHWTGHNGKPIHTVNSLHHSHHILTGSADIQMWDGDTGKLLRTINLPSKGL